MEDANRPETDVNAGEDVQYKRVLLDTRLNNRVIDLRVRLVYHPRHGKPDSSSLARLKRIRRSSNFKTPLAISSVTSWIRRASWKSTVPSYREPLLSPVHLFSRSIISKVNTYFVYISDLVPHLPPRQCFPGTVTSISQTNGNRR